MIHPHTELRPVREEIGSGVFATAHIPMGTIVHVKDGLDLEIPPGSPLLADPALHTHIERYTYLEPDGTRVLCWDLGKYVNHCCRSNTLNTGYGFSIAVEDIRPGQEMTEDYGPLNLRLDVLLCTRSGCRGAVCSDDFERLADTWDAQIQRALARLEAVEQPLLRYLDADTAEALRRYVRTGRAYRSVRGLRHVPLAASSSGPVPQTAP